ncbi:unnamed protein product [Cyprideis torosa]|uniref:Uncharacterized protein n=1 Tax=Cyprideis torosa TaxID=163714 RepID=A0A7R8WJ69_9CRUS|nr:unnamed protein product [Cyprideis torosa]CAG0899711.1 unnamed protein product [Cyprideis torosa]
MLVYYDILRVRSGKVWSCLQDHHRVQSFDFDVPSLSLGSLFPEGRFTSSEEERIESRSSQVNDKDDNDLNDLDEDNQASTSDNGSQKSGKLLVHDSPIYYFKIPALPPPPPMFGSSTMFFPPPQMFLTHDSRDRESASSYNSVTSSPPFGPSQSFRLTLPFASNGRPSLIHHWSMPAPSVYNLPTSFISNAKPGGIYTYPRPTANFYQQPSVPPSVLSAEVLQNLLMSQQSASGSGNYVLGAKNLAQSALTNQITRLSKQKYAFNGRPSNIYVYKSKHPPELQPNIFFKKLPPSSSSGSGGLSTARRRWS